MTDTSTRKTDRRTVYTKMMIRDSFLNLKRTRSYNDITITDLCREAQISRGTFYLHYSNIRDVLEEVLDEAVSRTYGVLDLIDPPSGGCRDCTWPLCHFLRRNPKYHALFYDESLSDTIVDIIARRSLDDFVARMQQRTDLPEEACRAVFYFQLSGCLAVCRKNASCSEEQWKNVRSAVDTILEMGIRNL